MALNKVVQVRKQGRTHVPKSFVVIATSYTHQCVHTVTHTALGKRTSNHYPATAPPGSHRAVARRGCLCRWPTTSWCARLCQSHFRQRVRHNVFVEINKSLTHLQSTVDPFAETLVAAAGSAFVETPSTSKAFKVDRVTSLQVECCLDTCLVWTCDSTDMACCINVPRPRWRTSTSAPRLNA